MIVHIVLVKEFFIAFEGSEDSVNHRCGEQRVCPFIFLHVVGYRSQNFVATAGSSPYDGCRAGDCMARHVTSGSSLVGLNLGVEEVISGGLVSLVVSFN